MMGHFWKYGLIFRVFGILFIEGFYDRSLAKARVKFASLYIFCPMAWTSVGISFGCSFIGSRAFLTSGSVRSFTKSLIFIIHSIIIVKTLANSFCAVLGTSKILQFLQEASAYEESASYVPPSDADNRTRKILGTARRISVLVVGVGTFVAATECYLSYVVQDYGERWRALITVWAILAVLGFFVYDSMMLVVLTRVSDVLANYIHHQVCVLVRAFDKAAVAAERQRGVKLCGRIEKIRVNVSKIRGLIRLIDSVWHPAVISCAGCLIFLLCITVYAVLTNGLQHPVVKVTLCYSLYCLIGFVDLASMSQALVNQVNLCIYIYTTNWCYKGKDRRRIPLFCVCFSAVIILRRICPANTCFALI
ncbi:hypothetical protein HPB48_009247 [Haemaphysalis longicornis]|uniref:Gustatory receptor n=1 Tax=Haemaphysalis longicornis TaxID=44386 RepID=A0A9J6H0E8_HAELO|nr:hypothetical protein HPB48_009247 [Haemaphysalis longicornis]